MNAQHRVDGCCRNSLVESRGTASLRGHLVPLKSKGEIQASNDLTDVYVVELPAHAANVVLDIIRTAIPTVHPTQHLRRIIKTSFLPTPALGLISPNRVKASIYSGETRFLLVCSTALVGQSDLSALLSAHPPFKPAADPHKVVNRSFENIERSLSDSIFSPFPLVIHILPVPALAPTSASQADAWTAAYWPVAYKHTNPFGPQKSLVARAAAEVAPRAEAWLALAEAGARQAVQHGAMTTVSVGAAVIGRHLDIDGRAAQEPQCVIVAGDARLCGMLNGGSNGKQRAHCDTEIGNVMAHAVMRAIGMVARKRRRRQQQKKQGEKENDKTVVEFAHSRACCDPDESVFVTEPSTEVERAFFERDNIAPDGYLCVNLEIYLTHEPCVMCSMAILHSRFNRVVFARRMPLSGGMTVDERGIGHGLFWRPAELNWRFLCWEYVRDVVEDESDHSSGMRVAVHRRFNA